MGNDDKDPWIELCAEYAMLGLSPIQVLRDFLASYRRLMIENLETQVAKEVNDDE